MQTTDLTSFALGFALVILLLGALVLILQRFQQRALPGLLQRRIRILEVASVGPRQKLILLRVKDQELLVGVSAQQITTLATFVPELSEASAAEKSTPAPSGRAASDPLAQLATRMAQLLKKPRPDPDKP